MVWGPSSSLLLLETTDGDLGLRRRAILPWHKSGRVTGTAYFDAQKQEVFQKAKAVVLSANGLE